MLTFGGVLEVRSWSKEHETTQLIREYENALLKLEKEDNPLNNKNLEDLTTKMDEVNAWDYERMTFIL
ncbi:hypothetical protein N9Y26_01190 [bacterium]|nr:hypothetical protein [bacterium]